MTKRKPFAKVEAHTIDGLICYFNLLANETIIDIYQHTEEKRVKQACGSLNAAHDKAVREAVKEFRERAARICEDSVKWYPRGNISECTKTPHELAAEIRALTTETDKED